jgi:hypothetical protein
VGAKSQLRIMTAMSFISWIVAPVSLTLSHRIRDAERRGEKAHSSMSRSLFTRRARPATSVALRTTLARACQTRSRSMIESKLIDRILVAQQLLCMPYQATQRSTNAQLWLGSCIAAESSITARNSPCAAAQNPHSLDPWIECR